MTEKEKLNTIPEIIKKGKTNQALQIFDKVVSNWDNKDLKKQVALLRGRFENYSKDKRSGLSNTDEVLIQINKAILEYLDEALDLIDSSNLMEGILSTGIDHNEKVLNFPKTFEIGLSSWESEHADDFFGREREIKECLHRIVEQQHNCLKIIGPSGVGKSSFIKAGIIPRLKGGSSGEDWPTLVMRPYLKPLENLLLALTEKSELFLDSEFRLLPHNLVSFVKQYEKHPDKLQERMLHILDGRAADAKFVLVIDQFEDFLTSYSTQTGPIEEEINPFLKFLELFIASQSGRNVLIVSIRSSSVELMGKDPWKNLALQMANNYYLLLEPQAVALDEIIQRPLERANFSIEPELVTTLRNDLLRKKAYQASAFPLLSLTIQIMGDEWKKQLKADASTPRKLSLSLYRSEQVGELSGVVKATVNKLYRDRLPDESDRELLPELFFHLVRVDENRKALRKQLDLSLIKSDKKLTALVNALVDYRLLHEYKESAELIHEVLFHTWPELNKWLRENEPELFEISELDRNAKIWASSTDPNERLIPIEQIPKLERVLQKIDYYAHFLHENKGIEAETIRYIRASRKKALIDLIAEGETSTVKAILLGQPKYLPQSSRSDRHKELLEKFYYAMFPEEIPLNLVMPLEEQEWSGDELSKKTTFDTLAADVRFNFFTKSDLTDLQDIAGKKFNLGHYAALAGKIAVLERLNNLGMDMLGPEALSAGGSLPFHMAVYGNQLNTAQWFLDFVENQGNKKSRLELVNKTTKEKTTAIMFAAHAGYEDMFRFLMKEGAILAAKESKGNTAVHFASTTGHIGILTLILEKNCKEEEKRLLQGAIEPTPDSELKVNQANEPDTSDYKPTILDINAPNTSNQSPLYLAARFGHIECVKILLKYGANLNPAIEATPLQGAIFSGKLELVKLLVSKGADIKARSELQLSYLHDAISLGQDNLPIIRYLIEEKRVDPFFVDKHGNTSLHIALGLNDQVVIDYLLESLEESKLPSGVGSSLLSRALKNGDDKTIATLVTLGVELPLFTKIEKNPVTNQNEIQQLRGKDLRRFLEDKMVEVEDENWPIPPLINAHWELLSRGEAADLMTNLVDELPEIIYTTVDGFDAIRTRALSFYPNAILCEARALSAGEVLGYLSFIWHPTGFTFLNGTSPAIHKLNAEHPIQLDSSQTILEYLKFFCSVVHGEEGPFLVVEDFAELRWQKELAEDTKPTLESLIHPVQELINADTENQDKGWRMKACIHYGNALFSAEFEVETTGMVAMLDDQPLATNLPAMVTYFSRGLRRLRAVPSEAGISIIPTLPVAPEVKSDPKEKEEPAVLPALPEPAFLPIWSVYLDDVPGSTGRLSGKALRNIISKQLNIKHDFGWPMPPLLDGNWVEVPKQQATKLLYAIEPYISNNVKLPVTGFDAIRQLSINCYSETNLYEARAIGRDGCLGYLVFAAQGLERFVLLDGTLGKLRELNKSFDLQLETRDQALTYFCLFCRSIEVKQSIFSVLDSPKRFQWTSSIKEQDKKMLEGNANESRLRIEKIDQEDGIFWQIETLIHYKQQISRMRFEIDQTGDIKVQEELILASNFPLISEHFIDGYRFNHFLEILLRDE